MGSNPKPTTETKRIGKKIEKLIDSCGHGVYRVAAACGKSPSWVWSMIAGRATVETAEDALEIIDGAISTGIVDRVQPYSRAIALRTRMKDLGITAVQLASIMGMHKSGVRQCLTGYSNRKLVKKATKALDRYLESATAPKPPPVAKGNGKSEQTDQTVMFRGTEMKKAPTTLDKDEIVLIKVGGYVCSVSATASADGEIFPVYAVATVRGYEKQN